MAQTNKTEQEWREQLDDETFRVTRQAGTERPFSGQYNEHFEDGVYHCVCCGHPLFDSSSKFHSGCGWPSYHSELDEAGIKQRSDDSHGMRRTELLCSNCDAHLGHIFNARPRPACATASTRSAWNSSPGKTKKKVHHRGLEATEENTVAVFLKFSVFSVPLW